MVISSARRGRICTDTVPVSIPLINLHHFVSATEVIIIIRRHSDEGEEIDGAAWYIVHCLMVHAHAQMPWPREIRHGP
jgi:hypothetical protein